jgi:hypothetical protein
VLGALADGRKHELAAALMPDILPLNVFGGLCCDAQGFSLFSLHSLPHIRAYWGLFEMVAFDSGAVAVDIPLRAEVLYLRRTET